MENALGAFVQYEYEFRNDLNLGIKYLAAEYEPVTEGNASLDGSYLSITTSYRF